jgi:hypothetical protein
MAYTAFVLSEASRALVLAAFPPKFPDVVAHHVTDTFGVPFVSGYTPPPSVVEVVGYSCDESLECLVVEVNGAAKRGDGKLYHITLSLDRNAGRRPVQSNVLLEEKGFVIVPPFALDTVPTLLR